MRKKALCDRHCSLLTSNFSFFNFYCGQRTAPVRQQGMLHPSQISINVLVFMAAALYLVLAFIKIKISHYKYTTKRSLVYDKDDF
jgi:hypothetical protein